MQDNFDDIRPYRDFEMPGAMARLSRNLDFIKGFRRFLLPNFPKFLYPLADTFVKIFIGGKLRKIKTVSAFQKEIGVSYGVKNVVKWSSNGLSFSGLENIPGEKACLFISNHRDIVLDPAFINAALAWNHKDCTEIAIGNNLLMTDFVSDLMRASGSFIVKRGLTPREQMKESKRLSAYIWSVLQRGTSVWVAQREGRAKDGDDRTNPAIIKMLYYSHKKTGIDFNSFIKSCNIIPVAVSYEYDPCDRLKAREIKRKMKHKGNYRKRENEDLFTILASFKGNKGRIHISFGPVLNHHNYSHSKDVAHALDDSIHRSYHLWPSNYIAWDTINNSSKYRDKYTDEEKKNFLDRFKTLPPDIMEIALSAYVKPLSNQEKVQYNLS